MSDRLGRPLYERAGRATTPEIAALVMREHGCSVLWYGNRNLLHEIANRAGFKPGHPLNRTASVVRVVGRSGLFEAAGYIRHLGRRYPCYRVRDPHTNQPS